MTVGQWLRSREPAPPATLMARLESQLGEHLHADMSQAVEVFTTTGESLVRELIRTGATDRPTALDLLVADALVSYAFEAASEKSSTIPAAAAEAMKRLAAIPQLTSA